MVDTALSGLVALTGAGLANNDLFLVTDVSAGAAGSKKMTSAEQLIGLLSIGDAYQFGGADAAAPDVQVLSVQNVLAGTSNVAGAALTIRGSRGTGTGAGGDVIFNVAPAGSAGSAQNALRDTFKLGADGRTWVGCSGGSVFASLEADAANSLVINNYAGFAWAMVHAGGFNIRGDGYLGFGSGAASAGGDAKLWRDASNTFAQRNGATAQTKRVYNTWSDASNGEWIELGFGTSGVYANVPYIAAKENGSGVQRQLALGLPGLESTFADLRILSESYAAGLDTSHLASAVMTFRVSSSGWYQFKLGNVTNCSGNVSDMGLCSGKISFPYKLGTKLAIIDVGMNAGWDESVATLSIRGGQQAPGNTTTAGMVGGSIEVLAGEGANTAGNCHGGNVTIRGGLQHGTGHVGYIIMEDLPTSSAGLPTGALWKNGTAINIV